MGRATRNTDPSAIPLSDPTYVYDISGTLSVTIDFTSKTFSGNITLTATQNGTSYSLGSFTIAQSGGAALKPLTGTVGNGRFGGLIGGPAAEELGGSFHLSAPDPVRPGQMIEIVVTGAAKR